MKKLPELILLLLALNLIPLRSVDGLPVPVKAAGSFIICIAWLVILLRPGRTKTASRRLRRISRGADLIWLGGVSAFVEIFLLIWYCVESSAGTLMKVFSVVMPVLQLALVLLFGVMRVAVGSKQVKISDHVLLLMFWWVPVANIFIIRKFYQTARREYIIEADKLELEAARAENEICRTKYPILLVHGIFFRDWQLVNYWGRIPATLIRNGASVYYGKQQSAQSVADSAAEIRDTILQVLRETGAEKVNIIAHSKGGLDSRYAISRLGMEKYVATLTTINTPHKGCDMVDFLLDKLPESLVQSIAKRYNRIFARLGDTAPDFMAGVRDLSAVRARDYETEMPDMPGVSYRSFMSVMSSAGSAGFPLNLGYLLIKKLNGPNDGLVWEESARHGEYKLITTPQKRGVSHGDVIDLLRENIENYDVREFYAGLVSELKKQGY